MVFLFVSRRFLVPTHRPRKRGSAPREFPWGPLRRRIKCGNSGSIEIDLFTAIYRRDSFGDQIANGFDHPVGIIIDQNIDETLVITLLAAVDRPDEGAVA